MEKKIKMGTKVRYKTDMDNELNLIAIEHHPEGLYDTWICVHPFGHSKTGECNIYNCITEDLELGWK